MSRSAARLSAFQEKKQLTQLLPDQGAWSEEEYLWLTDHSSRLVEFSDGFVEVLPMPTDRHQAILGFLYLTFHLFLYPRGGKVRFAPLRLRLWAGKFREPDLLLLRMPGTRGGKTATGPAPTWSSKSSARIIRNGI
jgi:hypothetical protein